MKMINRLALFVSLLFLSTAAIAQDPEISVRVEPNGPCINSCSFNVIGPDLVASAKTSPIDTPYMGVQFRYLTSGTAMESISCDGRNQIVLKNIAPSSTTFGSSYTLGSDFYAQCSGQVVATVNSSAGLSNVEVRVITIGTGLPGSSSPTLGTFCGTQGVVCPPPPTPPPAPAARTCPSTDWCQGTTLVMCTGNYNITRYPGQCRSGGVL